MHKIKSKLILNFLLSLCLCFTTTSAISHDLPRLGSPADMVLTAKEREALGIKFQHAIDQHLSLIHDPLTSEYITALTERLLPTANLSGQTVRVTVAQNQDINALAGPTGIIVINAGTILATNNESQLASVLAHEIGHISHRHLLESIARQRQLNWGSLAGLIAAIAAGAAGNPNAAQGVLVSTVAAGTQSLINFTRQQEAEADSTSLKLMYRAGFDPYEMPAFFERMRQINHHLDEVPNFLRTHPASNARIAATRQLASQYPKAHVPSSLHYKLIKERLRVFTQQGTQSILNFYKNALSNKTKDTNKAPLEYGYALALNAQGQSEKALRYAKQLHHQNPQELYYTLLYGKLLFDHNQTNQSLQVLRHAAELYPDHYATVYSYGEKLIDAGKLKLAASYLRESIDNFPQSVTLWKLLAKAYYQMNDTVRAKRTLAHAYALQRHWKLAILQLKQLLANDSLDQDTRKMLQVELEQYKQKYQKFKRLMEMI